MEKQNRDYYPKGHVYHLCYNQNAPLGHWFWKFSIRQFSRQISFCLEKIGGQHPIESQQSIKENAIPMLEFMELVPFGVLRKTKDPSGFQIFVVAVNVGISVVKHVVLHLPVIHIACKNIHAAAHYLVYPFFGGIGAVIGVVHNVHAHAGHTNAHNHREQKLEPTGQMQC